MSIIDLILQRRQCQGKDRKVTLLPACIPGDLTTTVANFGRCARPYLRRKIL